MTRVRFLHHAPPYMPGDVIVYGDAIARDLEGKGVVEILPEDVARKDRDPPARPAKSG